MSRPFPADHALFDRVETSHDAGDVVDDIMRSCLAHARVGARAPLRELGRDVLLSNRSLERGYFRRPFIERLFEMFERDNTTYYGDTLWSFLALELWHREVIDRPEPRVV